MVRRYRFIYRKSSFGHREVSGVTGIVPGPPKGSRGSTGWGHLSQRAPWAEVGRGTSPWWAGAPPWAPLRLGLETLGVGAPHLTWGASPPLGRRPPLEIGSPRAGAPLGTLYIVGGGGREAAPQALGLPLSLP